MKIRRENHSFLKIQLNDYRIREHGMYRIDRKQTVIKTHELPVWFKAVMEVKDERCTGKSSILRDYFLLLLFTGLRRHEAIELTWDRIDFKAKTITIADINFTLHDLRRTFITIAESLDIPAYALKRLLNHKMTQDVTAGYIVMDVERLRAPIQKITDYLLKLVEIKDHTNVVNLHQRIG